VGAPRGGKSLVHCDVNGQDRDKALYDTAHMMEFNCVRRLYGSAPATTVIGFVRAR